MTPVGTLFVLCLCLAVPPDKVFSAPRERIPGLPGEYVVDCGYRELLFEAASSGLPYRCQETSDGKIISQDILESLMEEDMELYAQVLKVLRNTEFRLFKEEQNSVPLIENKIYLISQDNDFYEVSFPVQCKPGEVYMAEVDGCVAVSAPQLRGKTEEQKPIHAEGILQDSSVGGILPQKYLTDPCPEGHTYASEIDLCLPTSLAPPTKSNPSPLKGHIMSQITTSQPKECPDGSVFLSEVGICGPSEVKINGTQHISEDDSINDSSKEDKEHERTATVIYDLTTCPPGQILLSELDICVPINNCYPYPDCRSMPTTPITVRDKEKDS